MCSSDLKFIYFIYYFWLCRASHHRGLSCCGAQAPDTQAQQLWPTGPAAPRHVGSPQTRARTRVPCISRQTPNHCATREALAILIMVFLGEDLFGFILFGILCASRTWICFLLHVWEVSSNNFIKYIFYPLFSLFSGSVLPLSLTAELSSWPLYPSP